jgi:hypothetical protein
MRTAWEAVGLVLLCVLLLLEGLLLFCTSKKGWRT